MKEWTYRFALPLVLVALVPALIGLHLYSNQADRLKRDEIRTCRQVEHLKTLRRAEIQSQLAESKQYLVRHPNGAPGIPRSLIERGITRSQEQLQKLAPLQCK